MISNDYRRVLQLVTLPTRDCQEMSLQDREKYWHDHVAREHYKSTLNRQKLLSSSSSSSSLSKLKLGPHDIKSCSLNYSGWPQSSVHTSSSTQQKLWEETMSFGR